ncbi:MULTISPECIES: hypothetical protein [Rhizobium]|uniref:hypothetical protein n=1 Tax=Rhizobium TaxID=379 RepID=UPI0019560B0B|nr:MULTISPECIES: hypothetical protein [Rhizobium]MBM7046598.1 hypothetical protein [Rhizobium lusitanum]
MSILRLIEVSVASAKAAIDTASTPPSDADADAAIMRFGVLEFLRVHALSVEAQGNDADLLKAYRAWLETAVGVFSTGRQDLVPDYMRSAGLFTAELELAQARANGTLGASAAPATAA